MGWKEVGDFVLKAQLIRKVFAIVVLLFTLCLLATLDGDNIALIAIFSSIAGSAATFLFSPASKP